MKITLIDRNPERLKARQQLGLSNYLTLGTHKDGLLITYSAVRTLPDMKLLASFIDKNPATNATTGWRPEQPGLEGLLYSDVEITP